MVYSLIAAVSAGVGQGLAAAGLVGRGLTVARAAVDVVGGGLASVGSYLLHSPHPTWGGAAEAFGAGAATAGLFLGLGYGWGKLKAAPGFSGGSVSGSSSVVVTEGVANAAERGAVETAGTVVVQSNPAALKRARGTAVTEAKATSASKTATFIESNAVEIAKAPVAEAGQEAPFVQSEASSRKLGKNMETQGIQRPARTAAHHIVAGNDPRAAEARDVLEMFKIDINDPDNGVFLPHFKDSSAPGAYHPKLHTDVYYDNVNLLLRQAQTEVEARAILRRIGRKLLEDNFPH